MQALNYIVMGKSERTSPKRLGYVAGQPQNCGRFKSLAFLDTHTRFAPEWSANPTPHAQASGNVWLSFPGRINTGNHRVPMIMENIKFHSPLEPLVSNDLLSGER
jgi:hypothetical protein